MGEIVHLNEPIETPMFTLRPASGEVRPDLGFSPEMVAVPRGGDEVWGALRFDGSAPVASVRFWVAPEQRGRRLAAAMLRAVTGSLFASGAIRIEVRAPVRALAAIRSVMRAGFRPDGVARAAAHDGTDALVLGLLASDPPGPAPRSLPDLAGGQLSDGTVSLRPVAPEDVESHLRHRSSPDVYVGAALPVPPRLEEIVEVCEWRAAVDWLRGRSALMVIDDGTGYQGTIGLYDVAHIVGTGMVGYDLRAPARGKGYATRALRQVCRWAFDEVGLDRVWAGTSLHNTASQSVLRRSGFRMEGIERSGLPSPDGARRDTLLWALLSSDRRCNLQV